MMKDMSSYGSLWIIVDHCGSKKTVFNRNSFSQTNLLGHCGSLRGHFAEPNLPSESVLDLGIIVGHCGSSRVLQIPLRDVEDEEKDKCRFDVESRRGSSPGSDSHAVFKLLQAQIV